MVNDEHFSNITIIKREIDSRIIDSDAGFKRVHAPLYTRASSIVTSSSSISKSEQSEERASSRRESNLNHQNSVLDGFERYLKREADPDNKISDAEFRRMLDDAEANRKREEEKSDRSYRTTKWLFFGVGCVVCLFFGGWGERLNNFSGRRRSLLCHGGH